MKSAIEGPTVGQLSTGSAPVSAACSPWTARGSYSAVLCNELVFLSISLTPLCRSDASQPFVHMGHFCQDQILQIGILVKLISALSLTPGTISKGPPRSEFRRIAYLLFIVPSFRVPGHSQHDNSQLAVLGTNTPLQRIEKKKKNEKK